MTITYKGFKIKSRMNDDVETYLVFSKDEWIQPAGFRESSWEAQSYQEAKDFVDSQFTSDPVTEDNFLRYSAVSGFTLLTVEG